MACYGVFSELWHQYLNSSSSSSSNDDDDDDDDNNNNNNALFDIDVSHSFILPLSSQFLPSRMPSKFSLFCNEGGHQLLPLQCFLNFNSSQKKI